MLDDILLTMETCSAHDKAQIGEFLRKDIYSQKYKVASLGNVVTHPDYRGNGLATSATARLCQSLAQTVDHIGLNVKADNTAAMGLYEELGVEKVGPYYECMISTS